MKKIGLVTIVDYKNYGNRLQNYATQQVLKSLGCDVTTIVNMPIKNRQTLNKRIINSLRVSNLKEIKQKINNLVHRKRYIKVYEKKVGNFKEFTKKNIKETDFVISIDSIPLSIGDKYDYFVVGSDQVWNPIYRKGSSIDFLTFSPEDKRIAYAPSFGISEIPDNYQQTYKKWLSEFKYLSVREHAGAKIIKELTGREAPVIADPTLMLSKKEWMELSASSKIKPESNFLLTYFLGDISEEVNQFIQFISKKHKYKIINLGSYKDIEHYAADPGEFIDYINSSSLFLTDSFHGVVFSIILEKLFIVFDRNGKGPSMNSRIDTLLSKFQLEGRKWENVNETKNYFNINFSHTKPILEQERKNAYSYLKNALDIKEE